MLTEESIRQGIRTSLGSIVCKEIEVEHNTQTLFLHTMMPMTIEQFQGDGARDFRGIADFFSEFGNYTSMKNCTFDFKEESVEGPEEDYAVFTFSTSATEGWRSLAELDPQIQQHIAVDVFKKLLQILDSYRNCGINKNGYRPLLFICPESVYVILDENNELESLQLLPMPFSAQSTYAGLPREIDQKADISLDIFMVAYLYLLMRYSAQQPFDVDDLTQCDRLAELCLLPFMFRHPSLKELLGATEENASAESSDVSERVYDDDDDDDYDYEEDEEEDEETDADTDKPSRGLFGSIRKGKKRKDKKVADVSNGVKDTFDDET